MMNVPERRSVWFSVVGSINFTYIQVSLYSMLCNTAMPIWFYVIVIKKWYKKDVIGFFISETNKLERVWEKPPVSEILILNFSIFASLSQFILMHFRWCGYKGEKCLSVIFLYVCISIRAFTFNSYNLSNLKPIRRSFKGILIVSI